jgi:hypothetical protein
MRILLRVIVIMFLGAVVYGQEPDQTQKPLPALTQISSSGGSGYYFQSPGYDRFPMGEFTYITEGILDLGEVTFVFSTYSNTKDLPELPDALRVVESARFVPTKP